jgi:DNA polymerase-3 subunit gamma/tau
MYQALYRKYRPRSFSDVTGQEHITETIRRQLVSGRLSHAYLFVGTRGTGKTTCAKILSRAVNCLNSEDGNPCNICLSCAGIEDGSILDVLELDAASNNSVDNVRALRDEAIYSPASVKKRVYIVDEVHMLSISAFNALLKILEEPPEHILFILATTELHKVPATIQGRCQKYLFKRLSADSIATRLKLIASHEGLVLADDAVERLSLLADGSMRDGISLLDQCVSDKAIDLQHVLDTVGLAGQHELKRLIKAIADRDITTALDVLNALYNDGRDMASLLSELAGLIRDLLIFKITKDSTLIGFAASRAELSELSKTLEPERLFYCLEVFKDALSGLTRGGGSKLALEICLIRVCNERLSDDSAALISRISRLEAGVAGGTSGASTASSASGSGSVDSADDVRTVSKKILPAAVNADVSEQEPAANIEVLPEPQPQSEQEASPVAAALSGDFWPGILDNLSDHPSVRALLNDNSKVQAGMDGDILVISMADSFNASMIESEFMPLLKEAAGKALGRAVAIQIEVSAGDTEESKRDKLESLSAFGIVSFE